MNFYFSMKVKNYVEKLTSQLGGFTVLLLIVCLLPLLNSCLLSQEANKSESNSDKDENCPEQRPKFPGGNEALFAYIEDETSYPESAQEKGIEGKVVVTFVIDKNGQVSNPKVVKPVSDALDKEALRVVRNMPSWQPGRQRCQTVKAKYKLPIDFSQ